MILCALGLSDAFAHFKLNQNVRILHVEHLADGLRVYQRLPMPYLVANLLGETGEDGLPEAAPYTLNRMEDDVLLHYIDVQQLRASSTGLAQLAADGLVVAIDDSAAPAVIEDIRVYRNENRPDFATLDAARTAFQLAQDFSQFEQEAYVGDVTVDVVLRIDNLSTVYDYRLSSRLDPGLPDQEETANLILDYSPAGIRVFRERGLLLEPISVSRSALDAVLTFIVEGVKHILEGLDHVLFVICLVLGAARLSALLWRVTGFTIGHSVTLSLGFFGFVPSGAWFVPAVETGIALSIIYVAVIALYPAGGRGAGSGKSEWRVITVTSLIGLLHGLGFSFVLHNILSVTSPDIWQSLLAFNVGVEVGQVMIVIVAWLLFYLVSRCGAVAARLNRFAVAGCSAAIALYWVFERAAQVLQSL